MSEQKHIAGFLRKSNVLVMLGFFAKVALPILHPGLIFNSLHKTNSCNQEFMKTDETTSIGVVYSFFNLFELAHQSQNLPALL
ncbi:MAG: hypothetical protein ACK5JC_07900 [Bacteroidota bacterium]